MISVRVVTLGFAICWGSVAQMGAPTVRMQVLADADAQRWEAAWRTIERFGMAADKELQQDPELFSAVAVTAKHEGSGAALQRLIGLQNGGLRPAAALLTGNRFAAAGLYSNALALFELIPVAERDDAIWFNIALTHSKLRHFEEARRNYFRAIDLHPDYGEAYFHTGLDYAAQGQPGVAAAWLVRALQLEPARPDVALATIEQMLALGYVETARELVRRMADLRAESALFRTAEGETALASGNLAEAGIAFDRALVLKPDLPAALAGMAKLAAREGDTSRARALLEHAARIDPQSPAVLELARLAAAQSQTADALRYFAAGCQGGCAGEAALEYARTLLAAGRAQDAVRALNGRTGMENTGTYHYLRFRAFHKLGNASEAARESRAAESLRRAGAERLSFEAPKAYVQ